MQQSRPSAADAALRARCEKDRRLFARYFFHEKLADERTLRAIPFSAFHLAALDAPKPGYRERGPGQGWRRARMGPRGNGKTTIYLRVEIVHDIVYELERYIVILAESGSLSQARVLEIATELEHNKALRRVFGDLVGRQIWRRNAGHLLTRNGVTVLAKSMESQIRGLLHPITNARPSKICLDDAEDAGDVLNPELRERDRRRFSQDIEGAASVDGSTNFQFTGTPLHREALLPSLRANPAWDFQSYPAITQWPKRMDLWDRCRELWAAAGAHDPDDREDVGRKTAREIAERFYRANRKSMDEGAQVLWDHEPLFQLMLWRWTNGEAAFWKEKQLEPRDPSLATFDMERAVRHTIRDRHLVVRERDGRETKVALSSLRFFGFHDPAKADPKARRKRRRSLLGDFAAISVIGVEDLPTGGFRGHLVEAWMARKPPTEQVSAAFELGERWRYELVLEEDTLGLLKGVYRRTARERRERHLFWQMTVRALASQTQNKEARIAAMEPAVSNGWLTFNVDLPQDYWLQWVDHPTGDHDDGPDSGEGAWRSATKKRVGLTLVSLD